MPFRRGENVGPYRVVEPLGQGGMASVFKAYHSALDRYVALKVLHPAFMQDPNFLARFQREARVVAKLEHPNIVPIYDFAEHDGQPFLVMKYIEGHTLKAELGEHPLIADKSVEIISAVGDGLGYAHERGILHRDIKPSNVLLGTDRGIYLADFGLARIAQAGESTLSSDMLLGTPQYISPEQARGEHDLDEGTDIYSLGVVLYEMVVGRVPFNADTPFSIIHDHIYTPLPIPSEVNAEVSERMERVLLKALAKERQDRFQSVAELVQAYRTALREPESLAIAAPAAARADANDGASQDRAPAEEQVGSGHRRWLWPVAGLLMACMCTGAFLILANDNDVQAGVTASPPVALTRTLSVRETVGPSATPETDPADLARQAETLYQSGQMEQGRRMALRAADLYLEDELFVPAGAVLLRAVEFEGGPAEADAQLVDRTVYALFFSAESGARAIPLIQRAGETFPDWELIPALSGRLALHVRGPEADEARDFFLEQLRADTNNPYSQAVVAEERWQAGAREQAQAIGRRVLEMPAAPPWLLDHLQSLLQLATNDS